ncbi:MAG TPA: YfiR family protein [Thermoanaerobaculia bacterium]|nr:YfiR family protein [Thermoanaerobaculia bacterium]
MTVRIERLAVTLVIALNLALQANLSGAERAGEYQVKAAFLLKFASYVDWPEGKSSADPFVVGILGEDPFGAVLDEMLAGEAIRGRPLVARRFESASDAAREADILFISASEQSNLPRILETVDARPVLTVGDMDRFASRGGIVGFRVEGTSVRFEINLQQAEKARLKMSSQLLKLARIVTSGRDL